MGYEDINRLTITGNSLEDCRDKLYKLYGNDYRIVDKATDWVACGLFKLRQKPVTKLTYVVNHQNSYNPDNYFADRKREEEQMEKNREAFLEKQSSTLVTATIKQLNKTIEDLKTEIDDKFSKMPVGTAEKPESILKIEQMLSDNDFTLSYINMISDKIRNEFSLEQLEDFELVERRVVDWIGESISIHQEKPHRPPHVVIIVGPTGVGKTTTLVKLAAQFIIQFKNQNKKAEICFITTDSMRVGAMEQLSRWGELMNYNVLKAEKPEDLQTLYEQNRENMDAIFIDTSGFSPNDATHIAKMKMLLDVPGMNPDISLAVTASTKARDLQNIMQNYEPFGYSSVIITKCDESSQFGNIISVVSERHKELSYLTTGQQISQCIVNADPVWFLMRLENFKIDRVHIEDKFAR